ncbi:hypothetical protein COU61_00605, partial [Candidatus Pacearchaeota archaeon CG10_big_fil_rev_8_21_14_0_10_35_13]
RNNYYKEQKSGADKDLTNLKKTTDSLKGKLSNADKSEIDKLIKEAEKWAGKIGKGNEWALNQLLLKLAELNDKIAAIAAKDAKNAANKADDDANAGAGVVGGAKAQVTTESVFCKASDNEECMNHICPVQDKGNAGKDDGNNAGDLGGGDILVAGFLGISKVLTGMVIFPESEGYTQSSFDVSPLGRLGNLPEPITLPPINPLSGSYNGNLGIMPLEAEENLPEEKPIKEIPTNEKIAPPEQVEEQSEAEKNQLRNKAESLRIDEKEEALLKELGITKEGLSVTKEGKTVYFDDKGAFTYEEPRNLEVTELNVNEEINKIIDKKQKIVEKQKGILNSLEENSGITFRDGSYYYGNSRVSLEDKGGKIVFKDSALSGL